MLDIKFIRQNIEEVKKSIADRRMNVDLDELLGLDEKRRSLILKIEEGRALRNKKSDTKPSAEEIEKLRSLGNEITAMEKELGDLEGYHIELLKKVPNMIHPDVPRGGEEDFRVVETKGIPTKFDFEPKDHETLMTDLNLIDFERGAKVAGKKFYFSKNNLVRLNQALINYGIDIVTRHGYVLMETPDLAKDSILSGVGFNPRGPETQVYSVENSDLSLIGTAEITLGGYHANEILDLSKGPKKYVALSHCYRTEAGSYGRESKGLYRVHQFTKLEMFIYCKPEDSDKMHLEILNIEKEIIDGLGLPYRIIDIASGDLGASAYKKFDIEAWMVMRPSEERGSTEASRPNVKGSYGEITSTSNCTDYQTRRLNIKYRQKDGDTEFAHTLNGTAIVSSRFPIAIVENFQTKDGHIVIPKALHKYTGFKEI
ncbi:MAG: serine--tRNA ligase [Candidatus Yanofskybacteria bacterium RIFCSPHIGHO2_02_FULL_41_29]|uniref:Serine--tRNA ligase n=1 Tax=Candidatus Yanofskybacteria bacterium RIFCSPHIGHO2_01_FULL_41_53 TaxID=1802663 RepID=A0A1F8EIX3_9BACT|nr:MAG: serine--tRNA ligase [Candidatus Yanofskybacteria bacterium RIFCSPHIGHO2_01_FULL_41_53]OGN11838.1 MAG: serine--tRNA ligase [Candidatus Yanofskybacteria bacterium RIFCSPHIGHO2_02_FULL_41_29]OGN17256.1 MAG: serine--tRNA ligase [Candidatus Yanofskybacteria bacterium RIFCSPHIGHO2_12_FULL_41_9]OGN23086.1 MAG: serine--tRNA ligase [Candidatus Yanofskybacteria bacterium RIFCSPLOWO2_01_FULL_41_67]OGN29889.1 MAG: serine--tRNA ligase [Candidatus Yanofskybacteria bacterium RIFCSPLOWO2_02_FULL_41_13]